MTISIEKQVSRLVIIWIVIIAITIGGLYNHMNTIGANYYRFGPHDNFIIIGISINTPGKYFTAVLYCCLLYTSPSPRDRTRSRMPSSA